MRNLITYLLLFTVIINFSCKKEDKNIFSEPPQQREAEVLEALEKQLVSNNNGWVANIYTQLYDQGFSFYINFKDSSRLTMLSDIDAITMTVPQESGYRLRWLEQPSLLFDTYNYIHRLSDPMPDAQGGTANVGGAAGKGLISDFEFGLTYPTIDTLKNYPDKLTELLTIGRNNRLKVTFRKASADEAVFWLQGKMKSYINSVESYISNLGFAGIEISPGIFVQFFFDNKNLTYMWLNGSDVNVNYTAYAYGANSISLGDTISIGGQKITNFIWDNNKLYAQSGTQNILVKTIVPMPLNSLFGYNKMFRQLLLSTVDKQPTGVFKDSLTLAKSLMATSGRTFTNVNMIFTSASDLVMRIDYQSGTSAFQAEYGYTYTLDGNNIKLSPVIIDQTTTIRGNGNTRKNEFRPLYNYFSNKLFKLDYYSIDGRPGFFDISNTNSFCLGALN